MTHSSFQYIYTNVYSVAATSKQAYNRSSWFRVLLAAYADVCARHTSINNPTFSDNKPAVRFPPNVCSPSLALYINE